MGPSRILRRLGVLTLSVLAAGALAEPANAQVKVLVDASKDGGLWWFPQVGPFDPTQPHQGKALGDHLRRQGKVVDVTPRTDTITCSRLSQYHLVVVSAACNRHSPAELSAYAGYLARGGRLILLGDHSCVDCALAQSLGVHFGGSVFGTISSFAAHPITAGVTSLPFPAGGTITAAPSTATMLGFVDGMPAMGIMPSGAGTVFFLGETNGIQEVPQPFVDNLFGYMLAGAAPVDACGPPVAPGSLVVDSIEDRRVTVRFNPPATGPPPTGYVLKGGVTRGQVLAALATGSAAPTFTFTAPPGAFFIRMHSVSGGSESGPSNEVPLYVNFPTPPSPPTNLLAMVNGSSLALAWRNTYESGGITALVLDVSGSTTARVPLGMVDRFNFAGVPGGTYTLAVRATNAFGLSPPSNLVTLAFPAGCNGAPYMPDNFVAYAQGNTIFVMWDLAGGGPAPTGFALSVTGAFTGTFETTSRRMSGQVGPGVYGLSVQATNPCGASLSTPPQTVSVGIG
jgi:hypothetical protein